MCSFILYILRTILFFLWQPLVLFSSIVQFFLKIQLLLLYSFNNFWIFNWKWILAQASCVYKGLVDLYVSTSDSCYKWDTCAVQSILMSIGGGICQFASLLRQFGMSNMLLSLLNVVFFLWGLDHWSIRIYACTAHWRSFLWIKWKINYSTVILFLPLFFCHCLLKTRKAKRSICYKIKEIESILNLNFQRTATSFYTV